MLTRYLVVLTFLRTWLLTVQLGKNQTRTMVLRCSRASCPFHMSLLHMSRSELLSAGSTFRNDYLAFYRDALLNRLYNDFDAVMDGREWPPNSEAVTMSGIRRADHVIACVAQAVTDGIPGHFIETGVWRGGLSFLAAKTLQVMQQTSRRVYLADSFQGIPPPPNDGKQYTAQDRKAHSAKFKILNNNSVEWVQRDAARFHLAPTQLRFVVGFFKNSIPKNPEGIS